MSASSRRRPAAVSGAPLRAEEVLAGAEALGVALGSDQAEQLAHFAALLRKWSAVHNLTTIDRAADVLPLHLLDSLAILPELKRFVGERCDRILDVGSGGGLPGIPLAIACPQWQVTVLDAVQKKTAFLTQAKLELGLANLEAVHARVEAWRPRAVFDVIVSRAFSSLAQFVRLTSHLLAPGGVWAAMKGVLPTAEIADLPADAVALATVKLRVPLLDAERHLVLIRPR